MNGLHRKSKYLNKRKVAEIKEDELIVKQHGTIGFWGISQDNSAHFKVCYSQFF